MHARSLLTRGLLIVPLLAAACGTGATPAPTTTPAVAPAASNALSATPAATATPAAARTPTSAPTPTSAVAPTNAPVRSTTPTSGPRITSAVIARDVDNFKPMDPTDQFRLGATDVYLVGSLAGANNNTTVRVRWVAVDASAYSGNNPIDSDSVSGALSSFAFRLQRDDYLPVGRYAAEVWVDDAAPQQVPFSITPAAPPVEARPGATLPSAPAPNTPAAKPTNLEFILDASGSMSEPVGDVAKMDAAHSALHSLVGALPSNANLNVGLRAYSHRSAGVDKAQSCQDSELLSPMQGVAKDNLDARIDSIQAVGEYTPMAYAVQQAAHDFQAGDAQNVIVLVSDGKENCQADPASAIKAAAAPANIVVDVVGFDVQSDADAQSQLQSIAAATGGVYVDAQTPDDLSNALKKLASEQVKVIRAQNGPGQITFAVVPGATINSWRIWDAHDNKVVDDFSAHQNQYQLPAGTYDVFVSGINGGESAWVRAEIASGQDSVLPLGAMALTSRTSPDEFAIVDQDSNRRVASSYGEVPKQPFMLPAGRYEIQVRQGGGNWQTVQRNVQVQPNTIIQIQI